MFSPCARRRRKRKSPRRGPRASGGVARNADLVLVAVARKVTTPTKGAVTLQVLPERFSFTGPSPLSSSSIRRATTLPPFLPFGPSFASSSVSALAVSALSFSSGLAGSVLAVSFAAGLSDFDFALSDLPLSMSSLSDLAVLSSIGSDFASVAGLVVGAASVLVASALAVSVFSAGAAGVAAALSPLHFLMSAG